MSYVGRVLQPGEAVIHATRLHRVIFLPAALRLVMALVLLIVAISVYGDLRTILEILAGVVLLLALWAGARAALLQFGTELVVTDRRVIYKHGLLARHSLEMNRGRIESVDVEQTVLGRILGYGTVIVRGTGGTLEPIRLIHDPLSFRSHITAG